MVTKHRFRIHAAKVGLALLAGVLAVAMAVNGISVKSPVSLIVAAAFAGFAVWIVLLVPVVQGSKVRVGFGTVDFADGDPVGMQNLDIRVMRVVSLGTYLQVTAERPGGQPISIPLTRNGKPSHRPQDYMALAAAMRANPAIEPVATEVERLAGVASSPS